MQENTVNNFENKTTSVIAGLLRGILLTCMNIIVSIILTVYFIFNGGSFLNGFLYGFLFFIVFLVFSFFIVNKTKQLTVSDCISPLIIGAVSAVVFAPIAIFNFSFFSIFTCLAASLFLTITLFMYKAGRMSGSWLILPFLVFLYEILPIEFPTDIDNILCFGGNITNLVSFKLFGKPLNNSISNETSNKIIY